MKIVLGERRSGKTKLILDDFVNDLGNPILICGSNSARSYLNSELDSRGVSGKKARVFTLSQYKSGMAIGMPVSSIYIDDIECLIMDAIYENGTIGHVDVTFSVTPPKGFLKDFVKTYIKQVVDNEK